MENNTKHSELAATASAIYSATYYRVFDACIADGISVANADAIATASARCAAGYDD